MAVGRGCGVLVPPNPGHSHVSQKTRPLLRGLADQTIALKVFVGCTMAIPTATTTPIWSIKTRLDMKNRKRLKTDISIPLSNKRVAMKRA